MKAPLIGPILMTIALSACGIGSGNSFEDRVTGYACPDSGIEEFVEIDGGKAVPRCTENLESGINRVLAAEAEEEAASAQANAESDSNQSSANSGSGGSTRPSGCDRAELASRVISDYFYYGGNQSFSELDAALNAIAYFLEQNGYVYEALAIDNASSLEQAISVYSNLIPQICSG